MAEVFGSNAQMLMLGIVRQAVADYKYIANKINKRKWYSTKEYMELRKFFKSEWCYALTGGVDGCWLLKRLDDEFEIGEIDWSMPIVKPSPKLTQEQYEMLVKLREVDGLSFTQIGEIFDRSSASVYWHYHQYKQKEQKQ